MKHRFDEARLKALVLSMLRRNDRIGRDCLLASELRLPTGGARADLAVLGSELLGIEIKSPLDSLKRLDNQLAAYLRYFDRVLLFASRKHLPALTGPLIRNVEVWEFDETSGELKQHREVCTDASCAVERRDELSFLNQAEVARLVSPGRNWNAISDLRQGEKRQILHAAFSRRYGDTSRAFWRAVARRDVRPEDLRRLSRYHDKRVRRRDSEKKREEYWAQWQASAAQVFSQL